MVDAVRGEVEQLRKQVEATGQVQVEALVLLTRAVDELNIRMQNLENHRQSSDD